MKIFLSLASVAALALLCSFSAPINAPLTTSPIDVAVEESPDFFKADYLYNVVNCDLETRFELQFGNRVHDVTHVNVHFNEVNDYYYAVHGVAPNGEAVVEYFKTTAEEVANEKYDYIQMTERSTNAIKVCREVTSFPFPGNFCDSKNNGPICGFEWWPGVCFLY